MKGKKKTRGLKATLAAPMMIESPEQRIQRSAEYLLKDAVEASPGFKPLAKKIGRAARHGAGKLLRTLGRSGGGDKAVSE